jgi:hypothetical protein
MELENIILSEVSQAQKVKSHKSWKEGEAPWALKTGGRESFLGL